MQSRAGAIMWQIYAHPHQVFPYKTFKVLADASIGAVIHSMLACVLDGWTSELCKHYNVQNLPDELMHILGVSAMQQATDIGHIEANHASVRRQVTMRSIQTWVSGAVGASTHWLLQRHRKMSAPLKKQVQKQKSGVVVLGVNKLKLALFSGPSFEVKSQVRKQRRAGGAWRAWQQLRLGGKPGRPDVKAAAVEYHDMKRRGDAFIKTLKALGRASKVLAHLQTQPKRKTTMAKRLKDQKQLAIRSFYRQQSRQPFAQQAFAI
eukprot:6459822-Amphidinium_carterae.1